MICGKNPVVATNFKTAQLDALVVTFTVITTKIIMSQPASDKGLESPLQFGSVLGPLLFLFLLNFLKCYLQMIEMHFIPTRIHMYS